jgi:hypothetical protein
MAVAFALTIAAGVGIILTAVYVMWELGHFTTPSVAENRFDERREIFAYTAGLFIGIVLVVPFLFYLTYFSYGTLYPTLVYLVVVVILAEVAQWAVQRTHYWGHGPSFPFYALGLRAGFAGLLITGLVAQYLQGSVTIEGATVVGLESLAILWLFVTSALLSLPADPVAGRTGGGPVSGGVILAVGLFLVGFNVFAGPLVGAVAAVIALVGALYLYARLRHLLERIRPMPPGPGSGTKIPSRYARQG